MIEKVYSSTFDQNTGSQTQNFTKKTTVPSTKTVFRLEQTGVVLELGNTPIKTVTYPSPTLSIARTATQTNTSSSNSQTAMNRDQRVYQNFIAEQFIFQATLSQTPLQQPQNNFITANETIFEAGDVNPFHESYSIENASQMFFNMLMSLSQDQEIPVSDLIPLLISGFEIADSESEGNLPLSSYKTLTQTLSLLNQQASRILNETT